MTNDPKSAHAVAGDEGVAGGRATESMRRVGFIMAPGFQVANLAAAAVFECVRIASGSLSYDVSLLSAAGDPVRSSMGVRIETHPHHGDVCDTVIIGGATELAPTPPALLGLVRNVIRGARRIAATGAGAFILAEAGLLDDRRATTHWSHARELRARHPQVRLEEDRIFVQDGEIWTSAGMAAGVDMALAMVEDDLGPDVALAVARRLVLYHRRSGSQSQVSALLELRAKSDRVQDAIAYARAHLHRPLSVAELAEAARLSPRQFSRAFHEETGQSPAKAVEKLRLEAARLMMEHTRHPVDTVVGQTGFADRERMRRAFLRAFGEPPQRIRRKARASLYALRNPELDRADNGSLP